MLFGVVTLMAIGSTIAIIGGKDALRRQFPYYAYIKTFELKSAWSWRSPVKLLNLISKCRLNQRINQYVQMFIAQIPHMRWITHFESMDSHRCSMLGTFRFCPSTFGCWKIVQSTWRWTWNFQRNQRELPHASILQETSANRQVNSTGFSLLVLFINKNFFSFYFIICQWCCFD